MIPIHTTTDIYSNTGENSFHDDLLQEHSLQDNSLFEQQEIIQLHKIDAHNNWVSYMNELRNIQSSIPFQIIKIKTLLNDRKRFELDCLSKIKNAGIIPISKLHYTFHTKRWKKLYIENIKLVQNNKNNEAVFALYLAKLFSFDNILLLYKTIPISSVQHDRNFNTHMLATNNYNRELEEYIEEIQAGNYILTRQNSVDLET